LPECSTLCQIFFGEQTKEIERIVSDYLKKHPEVISQAIEELQKRRKLQPPKLQRRKSLQHVLI